jgi:hypothetical protein
LRVFATLDHLCYGRTAWFADMFDTEPLLPLIGKPREADELVAYCERAGAALPWPTLLPLHDALDIA